MNNKIADFPKSYGPVENFTHRKNGNTQSANMSGLIAGTAMSSDNNMMLLEMENRNFNSEKQIEQLKIKLDEVVRTHAKFLSIIAHDLRSPFNAILYSLELIKMKLGDHHFDDLESYIFMASDSATRTLHLLDDLLDWTFSQHIDKSLNPIKLNLYELVEDQIAGLLGSAQQKQISISHFIASDLNVSADMQMVKSILRNLIGNAIKYTSAGGEITISASEGKKFVEIIVRDTGIGITQEAQKKLFKIERLYTTTGTNNEHGSGFGLILCKEFVEIQGGTMRVESKPGKGSKFIFTLPHYI